MTFNNFLYNSALYNAGRAEVGSFLRSVIQAHTGPHVKAVVGSSGGLSIISDFNVVEVPGSNNTLPTSFNFPDLSAYIKVFQRDTLDLPAQITIQAAKSLNARIVGFGPSVLRAIINGVMTGQADLPALLAAAVANLPAIIGAHQPQDLSALIEGFAKLANLPARIFTADAPRLFATISPVPSVNLGARIHTPVDLRAVIKLIDHIPDLSASIVPFSIFNLGAKISPHATGNLKAFLRVFKRETANLIALIRKRTDDENDLLATINPVFGDNDLHATIASLGGSASLPSFIRPAFGQVANLKATIGKEFGVESNLIALIKADTFKNLSGRINPVAFGEIHRDLPGSVYGLVQSDLSAILSVAGAFKDLGAILIPAGIVDLPAFIRVNETFITAIFKIITLASADLAASIGVPSCEGQSGYANLGAVVPFIFSKGDLSASISSFRTSDLGAIINSNNIYYSDSINVLYTPKRIRNKRFLVSDSIAVIYTPSTKADLRAFISSQPLSTNLPASLTAVFPLPRILEDSPRLTAADLRDPNRATNILQLRFQMEGTLLEYFYINGTQDSLIKDPNEKWKINVSSFSEVLNSLFGGLSRLRSCSIDDLGDFDTIDQAVRACIDAVLGVNNQKDLSAFISAEGSGFSSLRAEMTITNKHQFKNFSAVVNRVFPKDLLATIQSTGQAENLSGVISGIGSGSSELGSLVYCADSESSVLLDSASNLFVSSLAATITGS